ncbi:ATP-binding mismatch repair protein [Clydaea vesicula]|uniref:ATP-binding mismatch repair protein n=1 Tax=Clydaea vesicula TaxID=447962 RepID=A0AAD5TVZ4_9FUNG|nr:ATP-binding mismatch repair protein [Clydaea vesicula]
MAINTLPKTTQQRLSANQIVIAVENIVKELIENSIDAKATSIELKLIDGGISYISCKDDGFGITPEDAAVLVKRYTTSKITSFQDLTSLVTFGFRGEALNSICCTSQSFAIVTKMQNEEVGREYLYDTEGNIKSEKTCAAGSGSTIIASKIFHNLPVRRENALKQISNSQKKITHILEYYSLIFPKIRFNLKFFSEVSSSVTNQKIFQKPALENTLDVCKSLFGINVSSHLVEKEFKIPIADENADKNNVIKVELIVPDNPPPKSNFCKNYLYVNSRPIGIGNVDKFAKSIVKSFNKAIDQIGAEKRMNFLFLNLLVPLSAVDVNVVPDKTSVFIQGSDSILESIDLIFSELFKDYVTRSSSESLPKNALQKNSEKLPNKNGNSFFTPSHKKTDSEEVDLLRSEVTATEDFIIDQSTDKEDCGPVVILRDTTLIKPTVLPSSTSGINISKFGDFNEAKISKNARAVYTTPKDLLTQPKIKDSFNVTSIAPNNRKSEKNETEEVRDEAMIPIKKKTKLEPKDSESAFEFSGNKENAKNLFLNFDVNLNLNSIKKKYPNVKNSVEGFLNGKLNYEEFITQEKRKQSHTGDHLEKNINFKIVGKIKKSNFLVIQQQTDIFLFDFQRVEQAVTLQHLIASYSSKIRNLSTPKVLNINLFTEIELQCLKNLKTDNINETTLIIVDERITSNGFNLKLLNSHQRNMDIILYGVAKDRLIQNCETSLKEILELIQKATNSQEKLEEINKFHIVTQSTLNDCKEEAKKVINKDFDNYQLEKIELILFRFFKLDYIKIKDKILYFDFLCGYHVI